MAALAHRFQVWVTFSDPTFNYPFVEREMVPLRTAIQNTVGDDCTVEIEYVGLEDGETGRVR